MAWVASALLVAFTMIVSGETLEDTGRALAQKVVAHLTSSETAHVTSRNLTSLGAAEVTKTQAAFERALRRRVRNPVPVEITLTISENLKSYLLVAEIRRANERAVEMISFRNETMAAPARSAIALEKKLLWEQEAPILDLAVIGEQMLVLDTAGVSRYEGQGGKWERAESANTPGPAVRDPRGRIQISSDSLTAYLPGTTCRGTWSPGLVLRCEAGAEFSAGRNTFESQEWPAFFSHAQAGDQHLVGETDGRTHIYDAARRPVGAFDEWGSDFAAVSATCSGESIAATSPGDRYSNDLVALYHLVNNAPVRVSDPAELPGPVTALWPASGGALAVARNLVTGRYEAYSLTVDCRR